MRRPVQAALAIIAWQSVCAASLAAAPWPKVGPTVPEGVEAARAYAHDFPNSANALRRLIAAEFAAGNREAVVDGLGKLETMGFGLTRGTYHALSPLIGTEEAERFTDSNPAQWEEKAASQDFVAIPAEVRLSEGFAYDAKHRRLYAGSVVDGRLFKVADGKAKATRHRPSGSLFTMAIDGARDILWIGSGKADPGTFAKPFVGLVGWSLASDRDVRRVAVPKGAVALNDISVGPDGTVYASDGLGGGVYRLRAGAKSMDTLVAPGLFKSPQGIAADPARPVIYVADYGRGIARIDLKSGAVTRLDGPEGVMLDGTDGLVWKDGALVAIQNGIQPARVVRLKLDEVGQAVTHAEVLERANHEWGEPTVGQPVDGGILYASDPQWDRYGDKGELKGDAPLRPNVIRFLPFR